MIAVVIAIISEAVLLVCLKSIKSFIPPLKQNCSLWAITPYAIPIDKLIRAKLISSVFSILSLINN